MFCLVFIVSLAGLAHAYQVPQLDGRIVGGIPTEIEEHPYQLSFEFLNSHRCGASLIRPNVAVTAAHCTEDVGGLEAYLTVRGGSSLVHKGGQIARIVSMCDHPKFDTDTLDYDVSVLFLNQSLVLGTGVQTIALQPVNAEVPTGTVASVTGWGRLRQGGPLPPQLQLVEVPKIEQATCADLYYQNPLTDKNVTERMICFGYIDGKKDSCQGDSGGPLVVDGKLTGVVSWGVGCAKPKQPGVYVKVSHPEINSHISHCLKRFERYGF